MKKFIFLFVAVIGLLATSCTSCSPDVKAGIEYSLQSTGNADGNVAIAFDGGNFVINGVADYNFSWSNNIVLLNGECSSLEAALQSPDKDIRTAAQEIQAWVDNSIKVESLQGNYDIYIKGYIKETLTQLTVYIDRHFTNKSEDLLNLQ